jgi:putative DNA-invertase from lambdoid prophage Rac
VQVLSYQEPWTEAGGELLDLLLAIAGWVARMESNRRSERTKAGLARAVAQGKRLGRPKGSKDSKKRKRSGYFARYAN